MYRAKRYLKDTKQTLSLCFEVSVRASAKYQFETEAYPLLDPQLSSNGPVVSVRASARIEKYIFCGLMARPYVNLNE